ncbi:hypothetical protein M758_3G155300 [Ceratodon purpureus]|nr:hypothetical protein M758_3G155300 [Ceratodon purpureus]
MGSLDAPSVVETEVMEFAKPEDVILYVNGKCHVLPPDVAHQTLLEYLRGIGLTGTKLGCGEGGCGACTVMLSHYDWQAGTIVNRAINACLAPVYSVEGMHVVTVEGIGNRRLGLHPVQEALASAHGSQCGFCTPGFVMSMYSLLRTKKNAPTQSEIEECLAGNLCRCTGYRPILDAFRKFAKSETSAYTNDAIKAAGGQAPTKSTEQFICPSTGKPCDCGKVSKPKVVENGTAEHKSLTDEKKEREANGAELENNTGVKDNVPVPREEPIFPPKLFRRKTQPLFLRGRQGLQWYRPTSLAQLLALKAKYPNAKMVGGNTEVGIETRFKNFQYPVLIATTHVPELLAMKVTGGGVEIGASVTLTNLLESFSHFVRERSEDETSGCKAIIEQLRWFAGAQIRNVSSLGGNIVTASPISDLNPLWIATGAVFTVIGNGGATRKVAAKDFFIGYRKVDLKKDEILASVFMPFTKRFEYVKEYKQAHRRDDDIALVNAGLRVTLKSESDGAWTVEDSCLAYGGVAAVVVVAKKTQEFLKGKPWNRETLDQALALLEKEIFMADNAPGGMVEFRRSLISSFFFKFYLHTCYKLEAHAGFEHGLPETYRSAVAQYEREPSKGIQYFQTAKDATAVGLPFQHQSANLQVTGEAEYVDDIAMPARGLHAGLVLSTKPHARIVSIDASEAEKFPGFEGFFCAKDLPGANDIGAIVHDEELFATEFVTCVGHLIGIVVADTHENAKDAARKVKIEYEELPALLDLDAAVAANKFHPGSERVLEMGDVNSFFENAKGSDDVLVAEGEVRMGGQEHFYLEPNSTLVWTTDSGNEVHLVSSTQAPQKHQRYVSHVLGIPMNKVVCKLKRIGGGFGGKETRSAYIAAAASVPAYLLQRPVRITLDRDMDMAITGQRHAFMAKYKVGFTKEGKVLALDIDMYNNGGNSLDLSGSVLERALFHSDNVYHIKDMRVRGRVCFTNQSSNTAFRGFGGPQGMLIVENWIERVASEVGRRPEEIRELNFQEEGQELHYGQLLEAPRHRNVWAELKNSCEFERQLAEVEAFNAQHRWKKRGLSMVPTKFGISFTTKFLNQAGALVQVYTDGTVLVTHGGVEMGQGLHTKMAQIAASEFGIALKDVFVSETATDKVPNSSPTAASASADMYGGAVLDACEQIKARMKPVADKGNFATFAELVNECYLQRIDLSGHGFYITPDIGMDWDTGKGRPFSYFTFGAAFAVAEIDTLTGDFHLPRVDIVMDLGNSLNPAIDIGQVEGGYVQGLGWVILEELKWGDSAHPWIRPGNLFTQGPGTYKIPTVNDIPIDFRVSLLKVCMDTSQDLIFSMFSGALGLTYL